MRQIAFLLGLAAMALATPTLSEPRKISGINARTIVSDGQIAYVDNGAMIYRLQRTDEGVRKLDSIGYEGNRSEAALYIPRDLKTGFLVFKDSVCSVNWDWVKEDRMMCTGGVQLGWGDYTGGITMGKLNVCGAGHAYELEMNSNTPRLVDSMKYFPTTTSRVTCEVKSADQIEILVINDTRALMYQCLTVGACSDAPMTQSRPEDYRRNRLASNGGNVVVVDSLGRVGNWYEGAMTSAPAIEGFKPSPNQAVYIAAGWGTSGGYKPLAAVAFGNTLVFGRRVDLGITQDSRIEFDAVLRNVDIDKDALWVQVGPDIVSFNIKESISSVDAKPSALGSSLLRLGRTLEIRSMSGGTEVRILRADGRVEAQFQASSTAVQWVAPTPGLRIVQVGRATQTIVIP